MGTYCKNHVEEEVKKLEKSGVKVTRVPTKEGMCVHIGGCNTAHDDLFELKYDSEPAKEPKKSKKKDSDTDDD